MLALHEDFHSPFEAQEEPRWCFPDANDLRALCEASPHELWGDVNALVIRQGAVQDIIINYSIN